MQEHAYFFKKLKAFFGTYFLYETIKVWSIKNQKTLRQNIKFFKTLSKADAGNWFNGFMAWYHQLFSGLDF